MSALTRGGGKRQGKAELPHKICTACGRPFAWRKKWERVWADVRYCSKRCRRTRPATP
ncbi:DUF2256 domain-containing protein [Algihabitans albus]|uniref:DUF2256 domain-containing protein n=1 Tax=Algihabitans albus TaxID=2164067 RepID=UPI000E5D7CA2|nr:DUF2256 domain-containing protein [Algihabitans albus]